jgi:O-antigen/teichoic acid export membrane protein
MFTTSRMTGYYSIAEKLTTLAQMFPLAPLLGALYPRLSALYARRPRYTYRIVMRLQRYATLAYVIAVPVGMLLAPFLVFLLAGAPYPQAVKAFRILLLYVFLTNINAFRVQFLLVAGAQKSFAQIHALAGVLGSAVVVCCAYRWSYLGPPLAMVFVSGAIFLLTLRAVRHLEFRLTDASVSETELSAALP